MSRDTNPRKSPLTISKSSTPSAPSLATHSKFKELSDPHPSAPASAPSTGSIESQANQGANAKGTQKPGSVSPCADLQGNATQHIQNGMPGTATHAPTVSGGPGVEEWSHAGRGGRKARQINSSSNHGTEDGRSRSGQHPPHSRHAKGKPFHAKELRDETKNQPSFCRSSNNERPGSRHQSPSADAKKAERTAEGASGPAEAGPIKGHPSHTAQRAAAAAAAAATANEGTSASANAKCKDTKEQPSSSQAKGVPLVGASTKPHSYAQSKLAPLAGPIEPCSISASAPAPAPAPASSSAASSRSADLASLSSTSHATAAFSLPSPPPSLSAPLSISPPISLAFDIETPSGTLIRVPFSASDDPSAVAHRFCTEHNMLDLLDSLIYHFKDSIRIHAAFQQP